MPMRLALGSQHARCLLFVPSYFGPKVGSSHCEKIYIANLIERIMMLSRLVPLNVMERSLRRILLDSVCY